ncbi:MAG: DUF4402 domain-containing protein [Desulfobulbaceae bacterium]|nr:DUF4402 domain-containing protein [Desulfobulbaceae bacterium]
MNKRIECNKRIFKMALASALILGGTGLGINAYAANTAATATATVLTPIAIEKATDLVFGSFAPGVGGSVTVSTSGVRTVSGAILSAITANPTAAKFDVTGDGSSTYSISFTGTSTTLASTAVGTDTMDFTYVSDLTAGNAITGNVTAGVLTSGAQSIYVGGVLTVGAAQVAHADYTGSISVTVEYN